MKNKIKGNMELEKELKKLNELKSEDVEQFESQYLSIREKFISDDEVQFINNYVFNMIREVEKRHNAFIKETTMVLQQNEVALAI